MFIANVIIFYQDFKLNNQRKFYRLLSFKNFKLILQAIEIKNRTYSKWIKDLRMETIKFLWVCILSNGTAV